MPWSPIPKFPDIIDTLKSMGYEKEVTIKPLRKAVMMHTGIIRDESIKNTIEAMETLDFITRKTHGQNSVWIIGKIERKKEETEPIEDDNDIDKRIDDITME